MNYFIAKQETGKKAYKNCNFQVDLESDGEYTRIQKLDMWCIKQSFLKACFIIQTV